MSIIREQYTKYLTELYNNTYAYKYLFPVFQMEQLTFGQTVITPEYIAELASIEMDGIPSYKEWLIDRRNKRKNNNFEIWELEDSKLYYCVSWVGAHSRNHWIETLYDFDGKVFTEFKK